MQQEQCKNAVANSKGQATALVPQLWQFQRQEMERHKEGAANTDNSKGLLLYSF